MIDNNAFLDTIALLAAVAIGTLCLAYGLIIAIRALRNQISRRVIGYQLRRDAAYDYRATGILNSDLTVFFLNSGLRCIFPKVNVGAPWRDGLSQYLMDVDAFCDQMKAVLELRGHVETKLTLENGFVTLSAKKLPHGFIRLRASLDHLEVSEEVNVALIKCDDSRVSALNHAAMQILGAADMALHKVFPHITPRSGETILMRTRNGHKKYCVYPVHAAEGIYAILPPSNAGLTQSDAAFSDNLPVPILHLSMDGELLQLNSLAEKVLLINEGEKLHLSDLLGGLGRPVDEWLRDAAFNRAPKTSEFLTVLRSESEAFVQVSLTKVDTLGEPQVLAVLSDATQFKALEAQFLQSQKMQAIGQLSGGVAHDFNNLITAISGHCELLLLNRDASDPDFNDLIQIRENSNRAAGLVRKLLAFSRKQTLQLERCDINRLVVDVTHLLNRLVGDDVRLTFETSRSLPLARLDKRQFEQVLVNLVVNARDAMPKGGTVVVSTERMHFTQPTRMGKATLSEGEYCIVKVRDEGSGIAENNLEKVFEPFFTTKPVGEGTGLGLSMVYGTIKQIGGFILCRLSAVLARALVFICQLMSCMKKLIKK